MTPARTTANDRFYPAWRRQVTARHRTASGGAPRAIDRQSLVPRAEAPYSRMSVSDRQERIRVLVVEHDESWRRRFQRAMSRVFDVDIVESIAKANELLQQSRYDTIVVQDKLPDGSGRTLLANVKVSDPKCRRVLLSDVDVPTEQEINPSYEQFCAMPVNVYMLMAHVERLTLRNAYQGTVQGAV
jgi:response regulator RpfG family c-di-GMP phosphodiesterase